jgi:hypothetical protein
VLSRFKISGVSPIASLLDGDRQGRSWSGVAVEKLHRHARALKAGGGEQWEGTHADEHSDEAVGDASASSAIRAN